MLAVANNSLDKLHAAYFEYIKKRKKNIFSLNKNKLNEINEYKDINKKKILKVKLKIISLIKLSLKIKIK